jgi:hypothetical protein
MARVPELAAVFAVFMVGYVAWLGDRLSSVSAAAAATARHGVPALAAAASAAGRGDVVTTGAASIAGTGAAPAVRQPGDPASRAEAARQAGGCWPMLAPRAASCYKIAMGLTMGYMLIVML